MELTKRARGGIIKTVTVEVDVRYNCGCGFVASELKPAMLHTAATGHAVTAIGMIRKGEKK